MDPSDTDRDVRAELPTRHPCPLCEHTIGDVHFMPSVECWLCLGYGLEAETYKRWVLSGRPKVKPEGWT